MSRIDVMFFYAALYAGGPAWHSECFETTVLSARHMVEQLNREYAPLRIHVHWEQCKPQVEVPA